MVPSTTETLLSHSPPPRTIMSHPSPLFVLPLLLLLIVHAPGANATSFGVYHLSDRQAASGCRSVRVPPQMCTACPLKPFNGTGPHLNFGADAINRFDIYNLSSDACQNAMELYVRTNPCDDKRARAWANRGTLGSQQVWIYFMYSVCETCCDCIPIGAAVNQYNWRKRRNRLINVRRGNCAAHFFYDTCKIWPNAGRIVTTWDSDKRTPWVSPWCDNFRTWQFSPNAKGWLRNNNVNGTTYRMRRGMNMLMRASRCTNKRQWQDCVRMEKAQGRV